MNLLRYLDDGLDVLMEPTIPNDLPSLEEIGQTEEVNSGEVDSEVHEDNSSEENSSEGDYEM